MLAILPTWAANLIVITILVIVFAFPITYMIRRKLQGKSVSCSCGSPNMRRIKKKIEKELKEECSCCCNKENK